MRRSENRETRNDRFTATEGAEKTEGAEARNVKGEKGEVKNEESLLPIGLLLE